MSDLRTPFQRAVDEITTREDRRFFDAIVATASSGMLSSDDDPYSTAERVPEQKSLSDVREEMKRQAREEDIAARRRIAWPHSAEAGPGGA